MPHVPDGVLLGSDSPTCLRRHQPRRCTYGFEDLQLYRELAQPTHQRSIHEVEADQDLRDLAADVLRSWADEFPAPSSPNSSRATS
jgi:hypothetical protein